MYIFGAWLKRTLTFCNKHFPFIPKTSIVCVFQACPVSCLTLINVGIIINDARANTDVTDEAFIMGMRQYKIENADKSCCKANYHRSGIFQIFADR